MIDLALTRPIPVCSHPAMLQSYILATPSINEAYKHVSRCIRTRIPGSLVYAVTRYGKSYFIKYAMAMIAQDFPGIVALSFGCVKRRKPSESGFFSLLLESAGHAKCTGSVSDKRGRFQHKLLDLLKKSKQRRLVLFADEAQKLELEEYEWLREVHDELERKGSRTTTFLVGQPKLVNRKNSFRTSGEAQIVARFMIEEARFHGLRSRNDVQVCLRGYDTSIFPVGSEWSFTRFFVPKAWSAGYRLENCATDVWSCFHEVHKELGVPTGFEIPMTYFARSVEHLLTDIAPDVDDWAAAGFMDTLLRWKMKPEVVYGNEKAIQPGVQA
jgi:hypothetical protein